MDDQEGWYWPNNSRKAHYYRDGRSLCGRSMVIAIPPELIEPDTGKSSLDDCAACQKRFEKEKVKKQQ